MTEDAGVPPLRVLLVDDNPDDRALAVHVLRREFPALDARQVTSPEELDQAFTEGAFDVVITDYRIGWTDGQRVLEAVKSRWPNRPVIMYTGTGDEEVAVEAMKTGLDDYVLKTRKHTARLPAAVRLSQENARRREELRRAQEALRLLEETSATLAESLDYPTTLATVARLCVPQLGDHCLVDVLEEGGSLRRVAAARSESGGARPVPAELLSPPDPDREPAHPVFRVIRSGRAEVVGDAPDEPGAGPAASPEIRIFPPRTMMVVPLTARGRILGSITVVRAESSVPYAAADLSLVQEIARRAALAVDNAMLYGAALLASKAKSDFIGTMSHELRTPLNAIMGYIDLLDTEVGGPVTPAQRRYLDRVRASSVHLLEVVEEILAFARLESGREVLQVGATNVGSLLEDVGAVIEPLALERGIRLSVLRPEEQLEIETDARKLRQILVQLLGNAVKFTRSGEIELSARAEEPGVVLEVRDTGIGIPPEHLQHIFDPFWQVEQTTTRTAEGTGLGLAVVQRLARLLGGDVRVESTPGVGSTFTVALPRAWTG
ncbi:MAG: ATP-binding protein [Gemmatimonadota bacterium]|nr:ATP-binding protein [Gemmatimonadota bacterium]